MAEQRFDRRRVLKGAAAFGALGALAAVQEPPMAHADAKTGIEGTWLATVTTGGSGAPPPFQSLVTFAPGGGLVEADQSTPPSQRSAGQGMWVRTDDDQIRARFLAFLFDTSGHPQGTLIVPFTIRLSEEPETFAGTGTFQVVDLTGKVVDSGSFTLQGQRITIDAEE
jgi:FtsP/CotA-like multicopper oxidase with cupredoxin domain